MGFLIDRLSVIGAYFAELLRHGLPATVGSTDREVIFILDGVGGFQFVPLLARRALRGQNEVPGTTMFRWQFGLPGEIWTDLMWRRRNEHMAGVLAETLIAFRESHPLAAIHVLAFSGGAGIAVWACERLGGRARVQTLALACPALSPTYNLGPALRSVERCYALVSARDRWLLGVGTGLFGTTDRYFGPAAGQVGFTCPGSLSEEDARAYERLREIRWSPAFSEDGHRGGHTGWARVKFLRRHLLPIIRGEPLLPVHRVQSAAGTGPTIGVDASREGSGKGTAVGRKGTGSRDR